MASTNRFFLPTLPLPGDEVALGKDRSHYAARVLRLRTGDIVALFDGKGGELHAEIVRVSGKSVVALAGERSHRDVESPLAVHLLQGISRGERMDTVVQKATELGVRRISPVSTERSVVQLSAARAEKRTRHWRRVAESACEQCGRNVVPEVDAPLKLDAWLARPADAPVVRILLHAGADTALMSLRPAGGPVELLIGPEGGLSNAERELAFAAGFTACSLGPRILRTETAAIAAMALLQAHSGDLG